MSSTQTKFSLPELPYAQKALEPHIDAETMKIHHTKHHQGYVDKLNKALESAKDFQDWSLEKLLANLDKLPEDIREKVRQNGGGHSNHSLFWEIMSPDGGGDPSGDLGAAITASFGNYSNFRDKFKEHATGRFGSGWAWLVVDKNKKLAITDTPNQDSPLMNGETPILGVDVWEHAYYLNYQNERGKWIDGFFKVIDWNKVASKFEQANA